MGDAGSESGQACFSIDLHQGLSVSGNVQSLLATYQAANVASQSALVDAEANHRRVLKQLKAEKKKKKKILRALKGASVDDVLAAAAAKNAQSPGAAQ